jgi:hypothetical protein
VSDPSRVVPWKAAVFQAVETIVPKAHKDRILNETYLVRDNEQKLMKYTVNILNFIFIFLN